MSKPVKRERRRPSQAGASPSASRVSPGHPSGLGVPAGANSSAGVPADPSDRRSDRWRAHREQRRSEFLEAALRVLAREGPDLPMDAVAAEAGVTKPVLYRYFADKAALVDAVGQAGSQLLLDRLLPAMRSASPPLHRIREVIGAYFAVIDEYPNVYWLLARRPGFEGTSDTVQQDKEYIATTLTAILGDYLRVFGLDSGAAEPWAYGITGLVQSTGEWWLLRRSMSRVHVVEYVTQLIWAALSGIMREAGIVIDPDKPLPPVRPLVALWTTTAAEIDADEEESADGRP